MRVLLMFLLLLLDDGWRRMGQDGEGREEWECFRGGEGEIGGALASLDGGLNGK